MNQFTSVKSSLCLILIVFQMQFILAQNNIQYVNTFIGTDGTGHTFPGPSMPFGMVQPGPDNKNFGWNHTSGYQFQDTFLMGFSQTRFSGTGINEMGDILVLPINPSKEKFKNSYHKGTEWATVGYYSLTKKDNVKVELTCSERVAFHQYTFPNKDAQVLFDFQHGLRFVFDENQQKGLVVESVVNVENSTTISGFCRTQNWVNRTYYFSIVFDQPFTDTTLLQKNENDKAPKYMIRFNLGGSKVLKIKIALSAVDVDGARRNLQSEIGHWDFQSVCRTNKNVWNHYLNKVKIKAPKKQKEIFYTSLYHLFLQPSNIADVDGKYRGPDGKVGLAPNNEYYSTLSIWDIYRGAFPLLQILAPERIDGIIRTMLLHHEAKGFLPIWTAWGQDNYCMIGNHAIPMILSAYMNGFTGFDPKEALKAMVETTTKSHINSNWELYNKYGYYPFDQIDNEAVSRTLESSFDDWCVAKMASLLGDLKLASSYQTRANYYKNIYDSSTTFFRGKDSHGNWRNPFDPKMATSPLNNPGDYTEANAWQYFWTPAQHDLEGLIGLLGGENQFSQKLNAFFSTKSEHQSKFLGQEAMIGQYAHGNEPSHHILYLFPFTKQFKIGQKLVHQVLTGFHDHTPNGMIGNDDCGQMSAWYILSTLGFYPVNPATGNFVLGSPNVKKAVINIDGVKLFVIKAQNLSEQNIYNENPKFNGLELSNHQIRYKEIMKGGILKFNMTSQ